MSSIIIRPIVTEKMTAGSEKFNRYGFIVEATANKVQIKRAIEKTYNVTVDAVRTMNHIGKIKIRNTRSGAKIGRVNKNKKAIITLKQGDTIDFYSNV